MSEPRSTRPEIVGALTAGLIVVAFCLILLWHDPLLFWNDDYELSILPVFTDVARSWSEGHWPLLSPYSWVCSNLAGEYQYGIFSIFVNAAVVLIWKLPLRFAQQAAALSMAHLFVLAAGAFLLARARRLSIPLSIFVSMVAALNGWIICWGATDWFGALGAFAWLPWAWWALEKSLKGPSAASGGSAKDHGQDSSVAKNHWRFLWPAPFVYLVVTGGFPYTVVMLLLLTAWLGLRCLVETKTLSSVLPMLAGVALGFGLSAPAWLAIFDYVHGSAREVQAASAHWQWIVPLSALPGFVLPCWTVNWADFSTRMMPHAATELACGLVAPIALLSGFFTGGRVFVRRLKWELLFLLLVLVLSMMPTAGVFRWSFRWLPFFHLLLALCAAEALQSLRGAGFQPMRTGGMRVPLQNPGLLAFALIGITSAVMFALGKAGAHARPLTWIFFALAAIWALADFLIGRDAALPRPGQRSALSLPGAWLPTFVTFGAFLATYLCIPPNCGVPKYNLSQELLKPAPLDPNRLYLSIYPRAEDTYRSENKFGPVGQIARPGSTSMLAALRFINGYSPILAAGVAREFKFAIHGEIDPDIGRYLSEDQSGPAGILEQLGVDGIVVAQEVPVEPGQADWQLIVSDHEGRVFQRRGDPLPRVRSITWIDSRPSEEFAIATISRIEDSRNRVELDVSVPDGARPALLTFSRPYFRGYTARLGRQKLAVLSYRGLIPIVEIPPHSNGRLVLAYRPGWLVYGGALSCGCGAFWILAAFVLRRRS